jgi:maltose/maltodextrin transport system substrate-binding protein
MAGPPFCIFKIFICGLVACLFCGRSLAWTDGALSIWISGDKGYRGLAEVGKKFEKEGGIIVKIEEPARLTDKFQSVGQTNKGPDIIIWAHDRLGEWAGAGLIKPIDVTPGFKATLISKSWDAVTRNKQIWGYPIALEAVSLIYNKKFVTGKLPSQLSEIPEFARTLGAREPNVIPIMWDYTSPYFSWPFLASGGGYVFGRSSTGFDLNDIGINNSGAVEGLEAVVDLIKNGILPKGVSYNVMEQKMNAGQLAIMISGPWAWSKLRGSGVDFGLAPLPGVAGNPGRAFVGVLTAFINHSTPNAEIAVQFLERYLCTAEGLRTMDADVPLGVPALKSLADEMAASNPLIQTTYESTLNGEIMPNIPQMGKFWSSLAAALEVATNGQASAQTALDEARISMEK